MNANTRYSLLIMAACALDLGHKYSMLEWVNIAQRPPIEVTSFFHLVMVWNPGISFGFLAQSGPWPLIIMNFAIVLLLCFWLFFRSPSTLGAYALSLIIGGALGNIIDRIWHGAVADFFDFHIGNWHYPAFNIADSLVFIGAIMLLIDAYHGRKTHDA